MNIFYRILPILALLLFPVQDLLAGHDRGDRIIAIDIGHTSRVQGARSARGRGEFQFNLEVGTLLLQELVQRGYIHSFTIVNPGSLKARTAMAQKRNADLFISIHHDSVQSYFLDEWFFNNEKRKYCDLFQGYSLLVSTRNVKFHRSLYLATEIGVGLRRHGLAPTLHHALEVPGERHHLFQPDLGIYRYDNLVVLRTAPMPAVLVEVGVIVHREEEWRLRQRARQREVVKAIAEAVDDYWRP
ncbi:MAG: N-acetylmuramoyl-L-alanine amidase [Magnetococcales bacterium]|nr:N-acetylmuramoyl-L-alanine amidase [Magnetococcales bacterium]